MPSTRLSQRHIENPPVKAGLIPLHLADILAPQQETDTEIRKSRRITCTGVIVLTSNKYTEMMKESDRKEKEAAEMKHKQKEEREQRKLEKEQEKERKRKEREKKKGDSGRQRKGKGKKRSHSSSKESEDEAHPHEIVSCT